jgi:hypothetical protein
MYSPFLSFILNIHKATSSVEDCIGLNLLLFFASDLNKMHYLLNLPLLFWKKKPMKTFKSVDTTLICMLILRGH